MQDHGRRRWRRLQYLSRRANRHVRIERLCVDSGCCCGDRSGGGNRVHHLLLRDDGLAERVQLAAGRLRRLGLERELQEELLGLGIPVGPELVVGLLDLATRHLEADRLVGLGREQQVLPLLVGRLDVLLVGGHEAVSRQHTVGYLRIVDLKEQALLLGVRIALLGDFVARAADLDKLAYVDRGLGDGRRLRRSVGLLLGGATSQIRLVLLALGVRQIAALVVVQREAQLALVGAQVVAHKVRILEDVDGLERQLTQAFASVAIRLGRRRDTARARLAAG